MNQELGEIGGVFVSKQPSDTDMGAKAPRTQLGFNHPHMIVCAYLWFPLPRANRTVLLKGIFYGKVVNA